MFNLIYSILPYRIFLIFFDNSYEANISENKDYLFSTGKNRANGIF